LYKVIDEKRSGGKSDSYSKLVEEIRASSALKNELFDKLNVAKEETEKLKAIVGDSVCCSAHVCSLPR
jgi:hypothetical protein